VMRVKIETTKGEVRKGVKSIARDTLIACFVLFILFLIKTL
jgi:hypothetical protein